MVKVYAYGEKIGDIYVWYFPILSVYGLFEGTTTSHRWFISHRLRSCFKKAVIKSERQGISLPQGITKNVRIIKKIV